MKRGDVAMLTCGATTLVLMGLGSILMNGYCILAGLAMMFVTLGTLLANDS